MTGEMGEERRGQIRARLREIQQEIQDLQRELGDAAGEEAEERRRKFRLYIGGLGGLAAVVPAQAREHGRTLAAGFIGAAGGAAITAAVLAHPGAAPRAALPQMSRSPFPSAAITAPGPTPHPAGTHSGHSGRPPLPSGATIPSRRRSPAPTASQSPTGAPPSPEPSPVPTPSAVPTKPAPSPTRTPGPHPSPTPERTCPILLRVEPILSVCL